MTQQRKRKSFMGIRTDVYNRPGQVCMVAAIDISAQSSYYLFSLHDADDWVLLDIP